MLTQLHIQNIAVISKAAVEFTGGLNVFTGETGAGKTILISAIDAVLGERTSKDIIRTGEDKARVTALFEDVSEHVLRKLEELGYEDDGGAVLISREIQANGKGGCKLNGMPATAAILKELSRLLIHIHGQRDSAQLLAPERHMDMIDAFGALESDHSRYLEAYERMRGMHAELRSLQMNDAQKAQRIDMLTFQIEEIEAAGLDDPGEEDALQAQRKIIKNSEKIRDALSAAYMALRGGGESDGIDGLMNTLTGNMDVAAQYIDSIEPTAARLREIGYEFDEYAQELRGMLDEFEFDPRELDQIEFRLDVIYRLKRKYGASITEILQFLEEAGAELDAISTSEHRVAELTAALEKQTALAQSLAHALTEKRLSAAAAFVKQVGGELEFLDMPSVKLSAAHRPTALSPAGADEMELYIVTNVGEEPKPLSKIASGGELSRIMLAVKNVLAEKDGVGSLIFDEVDSGVSGRAAQKIGAKLSQAARSRQVICVTHLAQVAAYADNHLLIHKEVEDGRTFTKITSLDGEGAVRELARITGGDVITGAMLQSAREMRERSK